MLLAEVELHVPYAASSISSVSVPQLRFCARLGAPLVAGLVLGVDFRRNLSYPVTKALQNFTKKALCRASGRSEPCY
jgi:hypothetical protein